MAALEQLVDMARDKRDERAWRFNVVLRQSRPLLNHNAFQQILLKLVGDKVEIEVAKKIQKALKQVPAPSELQPRSIPRPAPYRRRQTRLLCLWATRAPGPLVLELFFQEWDGL
jgi:hypothetical protein